MATPGGNHRRVEISSDGVMHKLALDGIDLSDGMRGATLDIQAGHLPALTLDPIIKTSGTQVEQATVRLHPKAAELLIHLGWTPPADSVRPGPGCGYPG